MRIRFLLFVSAAVVVAGCQPVREDRHITFSEDGKSVAFQHGRDGVFLAGRDGSPVKIFDPGKDVVAVSSPLWSPDGKRLIFTTARPVKPDQPQERPTTRNLGDANPAGAVVSGGPVVYTIWLREGPPDDQTAKPKALFEASCDHAGYVAANLAVRWHRRENRIGFLDQVPGGRHALFEHDLASGTKRRLFPHDADAVLFDWTPDGTRLACVTGNKRTDAQADGIWIGEPDDGKWWRVPGSEALAEGRLSSLVEQLRATRPVWAAAGDRFAFTTTAPKQNRDDPDRHTLHLGTLSPRAVKAVAQGTEPFRDLRWAPDGKRVGVVRGRELGSLHVLDEEGRLSNAVGQRPVRRFAGWNRTGEHLAYVVPDSLPLSEGEPWAFLLLPDPLARDAVILAAGAGNGAAREVFAGMRVTFPEWSPTEDELSVWFTFSPTHDSLLLRFLGSGLTWGDPAAVFSPKPGKVRWLAVNAREKAQVGHHHLLKRDYAEAWRWYETAEKEAPAKPVDRGQAAVEHLNEDDFTLFQHHCLKKLGRDKEARVKLEAFLRGFRPAPPIERPARDGQPQPPLPPEQEEWRKAATGLAAAVQRAHYVAQAFLSLDASEDGCAVLREMLDRASTDADRLAAALMLGQVLLVRQQRAAYADLMTDTVLPKMLAFWMPHAKAALGRGNPDGNLLVLAASLALTPLFAPEFLTPLPAEQVERMAARWSDARAGVDDDLSRLAIDLALHAAYQRLGHDKERREVAERMRQNPASKDWLPEGGLDGMSAAVRKALDDGRRQWDASRQLGGMGSD